MGRGLTDTQFERFSQLIYQRFGIHMNSSKKDMLQAKLARVMKRREIDSYDEYYDLLSRDGNRRNWSEFASEITVNETSFFREIGHFDFIRNQIGFILENNRAIKTQGEVKVWSAGCSTGEEPYTLAITFREHLPPPLRVRILATDVSTRVLNIAEEGQYQKKILREVSPNVLSRYFEHSKDLFRVRKEIRDLVTFRQFNLLNPFPFRRQLDVIFCRNVMIYFDRVVQQDIIDRFYRALNLGGLLFIGHSESLIDKRHQFRYVQPTIYMK